MKFKHLLLCLLAFFHLGLTAAEKPVVLVSVAPHRFLTERIAEDTVDIHLLVPAAASAHSYEPTPKQVLENVKASLWLRMGESFEPAVLRMLTSYNPSLTVVDLRQNVPLISSDDHGHGACCQCHGKNGFDLHFWLSARMAKIQATTIANALSDLLPENTNRYKESLNRLLQELDATDAALSKQLAPLQERVFLASHPAYAYFCRDYNLTQLSLEIEGRDPTPQTMHHLLQYAKQQHINKIFIQPQYSTKGAFLFAKQLNAQVISLDPYAENLIQSLHEIANALTGEPLSSQ